MKNITPENSSVLAIAPSSEGFGFAVIEGKDTLIDWAVTYTSGDKNAVAISKINRLLDHYNPRAIIVEDFLASRSRRSHRIHALINRIAAMAEARKVKAVSLARRDIQRNFFGDRCGTKDDLAELLAGRFPEELAFRLPPKRKPWNSQDHRMLIFDAVALGLTFRSPKG